MNREIKFNVWDTKQGKFLENVPVIEAWIDSDSWDDPEEALEEPYEWQTAPTYNGRLIWLQYIGVKDINGKEIYEGDIIELSDGNRGVVKFENGSFFHTATSPINGLLYWNKVIGNIYENAELL